MNRGSAVHPVAWRHPVKPSRPCGGAGINSAPAPHHCHGLAVAIYPLLESTLKPPINERMFVRSLLPLVSPLKPKPTLMQVVSLTSL